MSTAPDVELCECGEPAVVSNGRDRWCGDCTPADVSADLAAEAAYEAWRETR